MDRYDYPTDEYEMKRHPQGDWVSFDDADAEIDAVKDKLSDKEDELYTANEDLQNAQRELDEKDAELAALRAEVERLLAENKQVQRLYRCPNRECSDEACTHRGLHERSASCKNIECFGYTCTLAGDPAPEEPK